MAVWSLLTVDPQPVHARPLFRFRDWPNLGPAGTNGKSVALRRLVLYAYGALADTILPNHHLCVAVPQRQKPTVTDRIPKPRDLGTYKAPTTPPLSASPAVQGTFPSPTRIPHPALRTAKKACLRPAHTPSLRADHPLPSSSAIEAPPTGSRPTFVIYHHRCHISSIPTRPRILGLFTDSPDENTLAIGQTPTKDEQKPAKLISLIPWEPVLVRKLGRPAPGSTQLGHG
ncbi:hypothetical protein CPLU01_12627 [Colletotrichum plurivorum]|uniref:Uncharacterized protein n=1 Tax=Colletotrichum plurivorum TaxID=2175906 RepID=A0A8H6N667_9PEZI|nr:hypothetical protein CPLU01_12627 [Colletotrichum plurivorum]